MNTIRFVVALTATFSTIMPAVANADLITFGFSGTVNFVEFSNGSLSEVSIGDTFSGTFQFDTDTIDANPNSARGQYFGAIDDLSLEVGLLTVLGFDGGIDIKNNLIGGAEDEYRIDADGVFLTFPFTLNGLDLDHFEFQLTDPTGTVFANDSLPTTPPSLSSFAGGFVALSFSDGELPPDEQTGHIVATIDSFTAVPEPSAFLFVGIALGVNVLLRRNKKKAVTMA